MLSEIASKVFHLHLWALDLSFSIAFAISIADSYSFSSTTIFTPPKMVKEGGLTYPSSFLNKALIILVYALSTVAVPVYAN